MRAPEDRATPAARRVSMPKSKVTSIASGKRPGGSARSNAGSRLRSTPSPEPTARSATARDGSGTKTSPLLRALTADEQRAVSLAAGGKSTLLSSSPRARDAAVFAAAASILTGPVLVTAPRAAELFERATALGGVDVLGWGAFARDSEASTKRRLARGGPVLVVVEPARLFDSALRQALGKTPPALVGIAAAHACSEHAHELCPAYFKARESLGQLPAARLGTCTSTTQRVITEVSELIGARGNVIERARSEIVRSAEVARASDRKAALFSLIARHGPPGVVLTLTPQEADGVYAELIASKVPAVRAHAGMSASERAAALSRFTDRRERCVLVTQSPHASVTGLAGDTELGTSLGSAPPRADLAFLVHYQAPLSPEQLFEDLAWLPAGAHSLVLADSSDAALVQALLAQQRIKPSAIEAVARALAQVSTERISAETLALRSGTSRRSVERVLSAFSEQNLIVRDGAQVSPNVVPEALGDAARSLAARFAELRAGDAPRAELIAAYVTGHHGASEEALPKVAQDLTT